MDEVSGGFMWAQGRELIHLVEVLENQSSAHGEKHFPKGIAAIEEGRCLLLEIFIKSFSYSTNFYWFLLMDKHQTMQIPNKEDAFPVFKERTLNKTSQ